MNHWIPTLTGRNGARYLTIVEALADDLASGALPHGFRLPPQRDLAECLGLSVGTVSKAYAEAERRGLVEGQVGRGTFVRGPTKRGRADRGEGSPVVNLALNVPPETGEAELIEALLMEIAKSGKARGLLGYLPHKGSPDHRDAIAEWFQWQNIAVDPERIFITHGAQHALSIGMSVVASPGDVILTENLTYSGMLALSSQMKYRLHGVEVDRYGLVPKALDRAFKETRARVLYCMPTFQTPTATVMPEERRGEIAALIEQNNAYLVEDDAYAFLCERAPMPISLLIPDRSFYAVSFAKCLAPGLRIGTLVPPDQFRDRCINALRASGWMAAPIMAEVVARAIRSGAMAEQVKRKRSKARERCELAQKILGYWLVPTDEPSFHVWLPLPAGRTLTDLITQANNAGIRIAAPGWVGSRDQSAQGVRLCLGSASDEHELEHALTEIARILTMTEEVSVV
jgi:DNA-binding transcriptional MocR family regulator